VEQNNKDTGTWKDYAGIAVCSITVLAFIAIGFVIMIGKMANMDMSPPGDWMAAMLSLASTALGWLAGQKSTKGSHAVEPQPNPSLQ
jgi:hypothetical protein